MESKPTLCLLCDGVMSSVERYEKHLRIDHRVVCRVNWIIDNTGKEDAVVIKKEDVSEVTEFIEEAIINGTLDAFENSEEDNNANTNVENDEFSPTEDFIKKTDDGKKSDQVPKRKRKSKKANSDTKLPRKNIVKIESNDAGDENVDTSYKLMDNDTSISPILIINPRSNSAKSNEGYGCSLCPDKVYRDKYKAKRHLKTHISKEDRDKVLCLECNKGFLNSDLLKEHMKLCEGLKELYYCSEISCEFSIANSEDLKQHKKTHRLDIISKRQFLCHACDKVFKKNDHLKRHLACHSDKKQFACDSCDKVFKRMDQVKRHAVTHTNTTFSCETCLKTFSRKYRMMEHQKSAHEMN